jgi:Leucine-rich repeat (LRR) protein
MNGFKDNVWKEMDKIDSIELVLEDFGSMGVLNRFKGIKTLTLINCSIASIEVVFVIFQGLGEASKLEALWLNENEISKIDGLDKCLSLKSLYLSHNSIKSIQGLSSLTNLETLWLCDNKIEAIENLDSLVNLKQLWIAGNQIDSIKTSLDNLVSLNDLNISGNKICSFKEVLNLNRLPNLKILSFYDPHFG